MTDIETLITENKTNHYKLLTIVGNNQAKIDRLVSHLKNEGWEIHDVEEKVFEITEAIPEDKIKLRIGRELKDWMRTVGNRIVLINSTILYSDEMNRMGPFDAFKYAMRGEREGILFLDAKLRGATAIYSTPDRPDYKESDIADVLFVELDNVELPEE